VEKLTSYTHQGGIYQKYLIKNAVKTNAEKIYSLKQQFSVVIYFKNIIWSKLNLSVLHDPSEIILYADLLHKNHFLSISKTIFVDFYE